MSLLSKQFIIPTILVAIFYIFVFIYVTNSALVGDALLGDYGVLYKITVILSLIEGLWTAISPSELVVLLAIALLTGANLTLVVSEIARLRKLGGLHFVVGGSSLFGIVASGCASCGLSILSLLGLGGALMYLPYHGSEFPYLSFVFLSLSFFLMVKNKNKSCEVKTRNPHTI